MLAYISIFYWLIYTNHTGNKTIKDGGAEVRRTAVGRLRQLVDYKQTGRMALCIVDQLAQWRFVDYEQLVNYT
jgi:hypothetical protein